MTDLLWQKAGVETNAKIMKFLAGNDVLLDREFFLHDITASKAHVEGLANIGVVNAKERDDLKRELDALAEGHISPVYAMLIISVVGMEDSVEYTSLVRVHAMHVLGGHMFTAHIRAMRRSDPVIPERHGSGWWNGVLRCQGERNLADRKSVV